MIPEGQFYHYKARAYYPVLGRFFQTDPAGYGSDVNWYAYARENPLNVSDPSGLDGIKGGVAPSLGAPDVCTNNCGGAGDATTVGDLVVTGAKPLTWQEQQGLTSMSNLAQLVSARTSLMGAVSEAPVRPPPRHRHVRPHRRKPLRRPRRFRVPQINSLRSPTGSMPQLR
jgi:hypothetical protein